MMDHIKKYREKLEKAICEYMDMPVFERSVTTLHSMMECLEDVSEFEEKMSYDWFSLHDAECWAKHMQNDDGTTGAHWEIKDTSAVAESIGLKFEHVTDWQWWITMNMIYSDYCGVAAKYGVSTAEFYADLAKAFLFDKDGGKPACKLGKYYFAIVKKEDKEY